MNKQDKQSTKKYWVYILLCDNGCYYTDYTTCLVKRYQSHLDGTGKCKYTRSFKPIKIAQCWVINDSKSLAMKLECHVKKLSHLEKLQLINAPSTLSEDSRVQVYTNPT